MVLPAEIDLTNADQVYDQLCAALSTGAPVIIADLTGTTFCDSSGLRRLLMARNQATARNVQLRLAILPGGAVRRVAELHGLDQLMPVYPSTDQASRDLKTLAPEPSPATSPGRSDPIAPRLPDSNADSSRSDQPQAAATGACQA